MTLNLNQSDADSFEFDLDEISTIDVTNDQSYSFNHLPLTFNSGSFLDESQHTRGLLADRIKSESDMFDLSDINSNALDGRVLTSSLTSDSSKTRDKNLIFQSKNEASKPPLANLNQKKKTSADAKSKDENFHYETGLAYYSSKEDDKAIKSFKKAMQLNPNDPCFSFMLGRCYLAQAQENKVVDTLKIANVAIDMFNKAIQLKNNDPSYYYFKSQAFYFLKNYNKAIQCLDLAIELKHDEPLFHSKRGEVSFFNENYAQAIVCFQSVTQLDLNDSYAHYMLAKSIHTKAHFEKQTNGGVYSLEKFEEAIESINKAIEIDPNVYEYHRVKAKAFFSVEMYAEAIDSFSQALNLDQSDSFVYFWRGRAFFEMQRWPEAEKDFLKAMSMKPSEKKFRTFLNEAISRKANKREPRRHFLINSRKETSRLRNTRPHQNQTKNSEQESEDFHYEAGMALFAAGKDGEAITSFKKALDLYPNDALLYYMLGRCYLIQAQEKSAPNSPENAAKAISMLNKAIQLKFEMPAFYYFKGEAYFFLQKFNEAIDSFNQAIQITNDEALFHSKKGEVAYCRADYDLAVKCFKTAKQLDPADSNTHYLLGKSIYAKAQLDKQESKGSFNSELYADAVNSVDRAIRLNPNVSKYHSMRGKALYSLEQFKDAIQSFSRVLTLDQNDHESYFWRGASFGKMQNLAKAEKDFLKATQLNPNEQVYVNFLNEVRTRKNRK